MQMECHLLYVTTHAKCPHVADYSLSQTTSGKCIGNCVTFQYHVNRYKPNKIYNSTFTSKSKFFFSKVNYYCPLNTWLVDIVSYNPCFVYISEYNINNTFMIIETNKKNIMGTNATRGVRCNQWVITYLL